VPSVVISESIWFYERGDKIVWGDRKFSLFSEACELLERSIGEKEISWQTCYLSSRFWVTICSLVIPSNCISYCSSLNLDWVSCSVSCLVSCCCFMSSYFRSETLHGFWLSSYNLANNSLSFNYSFLSFNWIISRDFYSSDSIMCVWLSAPNYLFCVNNLTALYIVKISFSNCECRVCLSWSACWSWCCREVFSCWVRDCSSSLESCSSWSWCWCFDYRWCSCVF